MVGKNIGVISFLSRAGGAGYLAADARVSITL
jgi:hypothetical protein